MSHRDQTKPYGAYAWVGNEWIKQKIGQEAATNLTFTIISI